jgi:hypothetical protein
VAGVQLASSILDVDAQGIKAYVAFKEGLLSPAPPPSVPPPPHVVPAKAEAAAMTTSIQTKMEQPK